METNATVFLYQNYDGYLPDAILVDSAESMGSAQTPLELSQSGRGNYLLVKADGTASYTTVCDEYSLLEVQTGGEADHITIKANGALNAAAGTRITSLTIEQFGNASVNGSLTEASISGALYLSGDGSSITITDSGLLSFFGEEQTLSDITIEGGRLNISSGSATRIMVGAESTLSISGGSICEVDFAAGSILNAGSLHENQWTISDITLHSGSLARLYTGTVLKGTISLGTAPVLLGTVDASGAVLNLLLTERNAGEDAFLSDWTQCAAGALTLTVSESQASGIYAMAGNAADFAAPITLQCGSYTAMALSANAGAVVYHNSAYTLTLTEGALSIEASAFETRAESTGASAVLSWGEINGTRSYSLALASDGGKTIDLQGILSEDIELLGLDDGAYTWQVRAEDELDNWQEAPGFTLSGAEAGPQLFSAQENGATDLFFVETDGAWNDQYVARHRGNLSEAGWRGTGEKVSLGGRARVTDIFAGSEDASVLLCPELQEGTSGIALFLDDIFSNAPGSDAERARITNIDTIIATDGDDVIDLTSQEFAFDGGVTLIGGAGNDVLWTNAGENIVAGGSGDDALVGGGGADTFCFGNDWGKDTVSQLAGGKVTLWFAEGDLSHWDGTTYRDGDNQVTVKCIGAGTVDVELRFGADGHSEDYASLAAIGAFD